MFLIDDIANDESVVVAATIVRFEATLAKIDLLGDDDSSAGAKKGKDKALAEEVRLTTTRDGMVVHMIELAATESRCTELRLFRHEALQMPSQTTRMPSRRRSRGS